MPLLYPAAGVGCAGMDLGIAGRVALVTGGSRGIGRAIAAELAAEGCSVAISSRSPAEAASELGVLGVPHDAGDLEGVPALVSEVESSLGGPIDILVVNTGGPRRGRTPSRSRARSGRRRTGRSCSRRWSSCARACPGCGRAAGGGS